MTEAKGTRQLNKEVCDKTRNTLVFQFSGRKKRREEHLRIHTQAKKHQSMSNYKGN